MYKRNLSQLNMQQQKTYSFLPFVQCFLKVVKVWRSFLTTEKEDLFSGTDSVDLI